MVPFCSAAHIPFTKKWSSPFLKKEMKAHGLVNIVNLIFQLDSECTASIMTVHQSTTIRHVAQSILLPCN